MHKKRQQFAVVVAIFATMMVNDALLGLQVLHSVTIPVLLAISITLKLAVLVSTLGLLRKHLTLLDKSRIDTLTKASSRDVFFDALSNVVQNSGGQRATEATSIILFDLDDFKQINDNIGHQVGDKVLLRVSNATQSMIRSDDIFARLGGEEFGILLPRTTLEDAIKLANRIREAISSTSQKSDKVTASFGVGTWTGMETVDHLYARVDTLMYRAKADGKNTVVSE